MQMVEVIVHIWRAPRARCSSNFAFKQTPANQLGVSNAQCYAALARALVRRAEQRGVLADACKWHAATVRNGGGYAWEWR